MVGMMVRDVLLSSDRKPYGLDINRYITSVCILCGVISTVFRNKDHPKNTSLVRCICYNCTKYSNDILPLYDNEYLDRFGNLLFAIPYLY